MPHNHWKTLTFVAALRVDRINAPWVIDGPINDELFTLYAEQVLAPTFAPGDDVILDNLGGHKGQAARRAMWALGTHLLFLPPYSPDLNPIEQLLAKLSPSSSTSIERASLTVLHNGIDPDAWPFQAYGDGSAVWCGRIAPVKGAHLAIAASRRAGLQLTLFGPIEETEYWDQQVAPLLGGAIRYGDHLGGAALAREIGRASVALFTPCWDEPFGLVAVEAMACGLPVAGFARGAAAEIVGEAGRLVPPGDEAALVGAIAAALTIPRTVPHARVLRLFTRDRWLNQCETLYVQAQTGQA